MDGEISRWLDREVDGWRENRWMDKEVDGWREK